MNAKYNAVHDSIGDINSLDVTFVTVVQWVAQTP